MRKKITTLLLALLAVLPLAANGSQPADTLTLRYAFTDLKAPALDLLSRSARLDMVDYAEAGKEHTALNEMYGKSTVTAWSDSCISVELTQVSRAELFLLPAKKKSLVALIYTVDAGGADSQIEFYDARLRPLKTKKYFTPPLIRDFMAPMWRSDEDALNTVTRCLPFPALEYEWVPAERLLKVKLAVKDIVSKEAYDYAVHYLVPTAADLVPTLLYRWDGSRFRRVE